MGQRIWNRRTWSSAWTACGHLNRSVNYTSAVCRWTLWQLAWPHWHHQRRSSFARYMLIFISQWPTTFWPHARKCLSEPRCCCCSSCRLHPFPIQRRQCGSWYHVSILRTIWLRSVLRVPLSMCTSPALWRTSRKLVLWTGLPLSWCCQREQAWKMWSSHATLPGCTPTTRNLSTYWWTTATSHFRVVIVMKWRPIWCSTQAMTSW
mmetsp:Transcript_24768/g.60075  ORF Transcript_24768/g.60075 Transcript_24768/m.60075 type:complete len:206 (+) Transcript_24768:274-891(+)